jgi:hypothetical protein
MAKLGLENQKNKGSFHSQVYLTRTVQQRPSVLWLSSPAARRSQLWPTLPSLGKFSTVTLSTSLNPGSNSQLWIVAHTWATGLCPCWHVSRESEYLGYSAFAVESSTHSPPKPVLWRTLQIEEGKSDGVRHLWPLNNQLNLLILIIHFTTYPKHYALMIQISRIQVPGGWAWNSVIECTQGPRFNLPHQEK